MSTHFNKSNNTDMNFDKFTIKSQEAIQHAQQMAAGLSNQSIETGHLLKALIETDENVISFLLKKVNANPTRIQQALDAMVKSYPKVSGGTGQYLSTSANAALSKSQQQLKEFGDEYVAV
jgi:ATP-dependent Clp protease ATP-binding subunit ClpB